MSNTSPSIFRVALDYTKDNFEWAMNNSLYPVYYFIFIAFGTAGIWFEYAFPEHSGPRGPFMNIFSFSPLLTFSAPVIVAILAKHLLMGFSQDHNGYPMKTLRTFCFIYFILIGIFFVLGFTNENGGTNWFSICAVILLLIFQFVYGAKDKDYEDVSLDISDRAAGNNKDSLKGGKL